ncbi:hypothetical protein CLOSTMETH_02209 [[Clostridium] methylpentosum DSM 5476]|uniref:Uncharacterized protein n=1 Tax=[Clostridium] methylpentosum DSM 5476 TaxID=537013 RepID=C0EEC9_9FIRM|nr:hypothetical protein CLOSTMETH_02209 [[Clostridium] methylpentosum DSM 5476]
MPKVFNTFSQGYFNPTQFCGIPPSMSSKGNPYGIMPFGHNAVVENCFSILKTECIYRYKSKHSPEANDLIGRYIHF